MERGNPAEGRTSGSLVPLCEEAMPDETRDRVREQVSAMVIGSCRLFATTRLHGLRVQQRCNSNRPGFFPFSLRPLDCSSSRGLSKTSAKQLVTIVALLTRG